jgi:four helix bundle protein
VRYGTHEGFSGFTCLEEAHALARSTYRVTSTFPRQEQFGLIAQMRRSVSSIPANIAEECGRGSDADFSRFLRIAIGSASEFEYHLLLACDLRFLSDTEHQVLFNQVTEVKRMLTGLVQKLKADR